MNQPLVMRQTITAILAILGPACAPAFWSVYEVRPEDFRERPWITVVGAWTNETTVSFTVVFAPRGKSSPGEYLYLDLYDEHEAYLARTLIRGEGIRDAMLQERAMRLGLESLWKKAKATVYEFTVNSRLLNKSRLSWQFGAMHDMPGVPSSGGGVEWCYLSTLAQASRSAPDADILDIVIRQPLGMTVDGKPAAYGDPYLAQAAKALSDIPHPWTVTKISAIFARESAAWLQKLQQRRDEKSDQMWPTYRKEADRVGHLGYVLAASRDPRAAAVLGNTLGNPDFPEQIGPIRGLYNYFLPDPRYKRLPPHELGAYTNFLPQMGSWVREWWALNKDELNRAIQSPPPSN